jgi:hypothetical protein
MKRNGLLALTVVLQVAIVVPACQALTVADEKGAGQTEASFLTDAMRKDDPRLNAPLTLQIRSTTVGELLERLAAQTEVPLSAGERDGSADVAVAVFCKETPLYRVLNGLWSLMSYRTGRWAWERSGSKGGYSYRLSQPMAARKLRNTLSGWVQQVFEANAATLLDAVDGSPEQKKEALKRVYGDITPETDSKYYAFGQERLWTDVQAFKEALTPEQRTLVLRGEASFEVPLDKVSPGIRDGILKEWKEATKDTRYEVDGVEKPLPEPTKLHFRRDGYGSTHSLLVGHNKVASSSPAEFGGIPLERAYRQKLQALWMLDSDSKEDPSQNVAISKPTQSTPTGPQQTSLQHLAQRLEEVAVGAGVPLLARYPEDEPLYRLRVPDGEPVHEYWKQLWNIALMVKWHDGVQLVSTMAWPMEDLPVPLWLVRQLRKDARPGEFLPFGDITAAADILSGKQLMRLAAEFPVMKHVMAAQGLLALLHRYPQMGDQALTERGLPLTPQVVAALRRLLPSPLSEFLDNGEARYLTVKLVTNDTSGTAVRHVIFQLRNQEGRFLRGLGFQYQPMPVKTPKGPATPNH